MLTMLNRTVVLAVVIVTIAAMGLNHMS